MSKREWVLREDVEAFELGESGARMTVWNGEEVLQLAGAYTLPVLLREDVGCDCYRMEAEVALHSAQGFIGLAFGARDHRNYELVYLYPDVDNAIGEIQYDPIMNGSSTWQIYNSPRYQAPARFPAGEWVNLRLDVHPHGVAIYVGDTSEPQLTIINLQHGRSNGKVGFWGNMPGYVRRLSIAEIDPSPFPIEQADLRKLAADSFMTEWMVSKPYSLEISTEPMVEWTDTALVEENGTLNLNRLYAASEPGIAVQAKSVFSLAEETDSLLTIGFSDEVLLWINDVEVYRGETRWDPPGSDGRIRPDHASVLVRWRVGDNTIRAEVVNREGMFGWGLVVKTGLRERS